MPETQPSSNRTISRKPNTRTGETREHILDHALALFNASDTASVTTNHIAAASGLSIGNLYYHFRNKEEIIRALYQRLAAEFDRIFAPPADRPLDIADLERMIGENYRVLWQYRFFYREMIALLERDALLKQHYQTVRERGFRDFHGLVTFFAESGVLRPIPDPAEVERLAQVCWLVSEFFLPFIEAGGTEITQEEFSGGIALLRHVLSPYMKEESS